MYSELNSVYLLRVIWFGSRPLKFVFMVKGFHPFAVKSTATIGVKDGGNTFILDKVEVAVWELRFGLEGVQA